MKLRSELPANERISLSATWQVPASMAVFGDNDTPQEHMTRTNCPLVSLVSKFQMFIVNGKFQAYPF